MVADLNTLLRLKTTVIGMKLFASDDEIIAQAPGGKVGETVDVLITFEGRGEIKILKAFTFVEKKGQGPSVDDLAPTKK